MITYEPFWSTLKNKGVTTYSLIYHHNISSSTLSRMRSNQPITTTTLNDLCKILDCNVEDILLYVPNDTDQSL